MSLRRNGLDEMSEKRSDIHPHSLWEWAYLVVMAILIAALAADLWLLIR